jgi:hypothetical protein
MKKAPEVPTLFADVLFMFGLARRASGNVISAPTPIHANDVFVTP